MSDDSDLRKKYAKDTEGRVYMPPGSVVKVEVTLFKGGGIDVRGLPDEDLQMAAMVIGLEFLGYDVTLKKREDGSIRDGMTVDTMSTPDTGLVLGPAAIG